MDKGEWKTINGAYVFIENGQNIDEAFSKYKEQEQKDYDNLSAREYGQKYATKDDLKPQYKKITSFKDNEDIDWDIAEKNEKVNAQKAKNYKRTDKYGNYLVSDEAFDIGAEAVKSYIDYMTKYNSYAQLKKSNQFLRGMTEVVGNAITNNGFNPNQDLTYTDYNEIIGSVLGEEVDTESNETNRMSGFTGRKYIGHKSSK